ncbi:MAG: argininosuccinate lyase, partial [Ferrovum sp.]|nr:argininosuccinate lyase [Ferrovum sp.]
MTQNSKPGTGSQSKIWSGRFSVPIAESVKAYTASVQFDRRLAEFDIQGSLAHAQMLCEVGLISPEDLHAIQSGMTTLLEEVRSGQFPWNLDDEDVHLNIERRLTLLIGDAGKRLHTARSRNDQVATDIRLYLRHEIDHLNELLRSVQAALLDLAESHAGTPMPGFTHLQVAQPVTFGHHMMAYVEMFGRDRERLS